MVSGRVWGMGKVEKSKLRSAMRNYITLFNDANPVGRFLLIPILVTSRLGAFVTWNLGLPRQRLGGLGDW